MSNLKFKWYTVDELVKDKILDQYRIKTNRINIIKFINSKKLKAVNVGGKGKGIRYIVRNDWVAEFLANMDAGKLDSV